MAHAFGGEPQSHGQTEGHLYFLQCFLLGVFNRVLYV